MTLSYSPPTREQLLEALTMLEDHVLARVRPSASNDESAAPMAVAA